MRFPLLTMAVALAAACATPALAGDGTTPSDAVIDTARTTVRLKDLDLTRPADVERLYLRMRRAVEVLCPAPAGDVTRYVKGRACQREVLERAIEGAGIPQLAELHRRQPVPAGNRVARR